MDRSIIDRVSDWARKHVPTEWTYNSRMTYWRSALHAGIVTREEYDAARTYYGSLWDYVGD